ncbi:hypothetical protein [Marinibacterium profundimaris]|uniref:Uncharacterized protein n=1 Tax=Marinibacterium profundimaris TaxID=1679460 RepID=A0A225NST8_9RHOB|nr:hypothetical protein [Marinibacterium profundimaris]OWU77889.1 hypothetical protein ATO3_04450 [Marinibacterium profundimaris]
MTGGLFGMAEQVLQTVGVAGLAGLWLVKAGLTALVFRVYQRRSGGRMPLMAARFMPRIPGRMGARVGPWLLRRRMPNGTNGR